MARIAGVNIPTGKRVPIALQYIHGIGPAFAGQIIESVGIDPARLVPTLHYDGTPITARFITATIAQRMRAAIGAPLPAQAANA